MKKVFPVTCKRRRRDMLLVWRRVSRDPVRDGAICNPAVLRVGFVTLRFFHFVAVSKVGLPDSQCRTKTWKSRGASSTS